MSHSLFDVYQSDGTDMRREQKENEEDAVWSSSLCRMRVECLTVREPAWQSRSQDLSPAFSEHTAGLSPYRSSG